ncbi:GHKL domain-containing protein, partial [candidate division KSB1 bacterium]|nr:GHKL domain-containing protein [candidate division KSB1 bacterium]
LRLFLQAEKGAILLRDQRDSMFRFAAWAGYETDVLKDIVICQEEATNRYADAPDEVDKGVYLPRNLKALVDDDRLADLAIPKSLLTMTVELDGVLEGFLMFLNMTDSEAFNRSDSRKLNRFREHAISAIAKAKTLQILQEKNEELVRTQKQLVVQEKLASLGELTAGIAHEIKNPLNFVNNFAELSVGLVDELKQEIKKNKEHLDSETAEHVDEILTDLAYNAGEIQQSGSRADSIIQGMLLHSRGGTGERRDTDINVLLNQYLALAYHSMRAQDSAFEATMENDYDESIGKISVVPQDLGRVFLNILNNACHAILERTKELPDGYSPTLSVSTKSLGDKVEIRIRDNGSGIAEEIKDKIFNPFFTTKPPGEGTGLGLSLSYDIIVKEHRGDIKVESERDSFTEFIITLPKE